MSFADAHGSGSSSVPAWAARATTTANNGSAPSWAQTRGTEPLVPVFEFAPIKKEIQRDLKEIAKAADVLAKLAKKRGDADAAQRMLAVSSENELGVMRQVDEVLRRFDQASDSVVTGRIDPLDPDSLERFESLILRLRSAYADEVELYESTLAQAIQIYADSVGQDAEFFAFYRSMEAYRKSMGQNDTSMVLSPESSFFRFFKDKNGTGQK